MEVGLLEEGKCKWRPEGSETLSAPQIHITSFTGFLKSPMYAVEIWRIHCHFFVDSFYSYIGENLCYVWPSTVEDWCCLNLYMWQLTAYDSHIYWKLKVKIIVAWCKALSSEGVLFVFLLIDELSDGSSWIIVSVPSFIDSFSDSL